MAKFTLYGNRRTKLLMTMCLLVALLQICRFLLLPGMTVWQQDEREIVSSFLAAMPTTAQWNNQLVAVHLQSNNTEATKTTVATISLNVRQSQAFTGFRYVKELQRCVPNKVSSSANRIIYENAWKTLPLANTTTTVDASSPSLALVKESFSFAVVRDPLERLYSAYWNKCLHAPAYEDHCVWFSTVEKQAGNITFSQFLRRNYRKDGFQKLLANSHFRPMTRICFGGKNRKQNYDIVLVMGSKNFNQDIAHLWKQLGANHSIVDKFFPTAKLRKLSWYHSNSSQTNIQQHYSDCETFHLAMAVAKHDYEGPRKQYFPKPQWAVKQMKACPPALFPENPIITGKRTRNKPKGRPSDGPQLQQQQPRKNRKLDPKFGSLVKQRHLEQLKWQQFKKT